MEDHRVETSELQDVYDGTIEHQEVVERKQRNVLNSDRNGPHHTIYWVQSKDEKNLKKSTLNTYEIGVKYTGDWDDNQRCGFGSQTWSNGTRYEGEWKNDKRDGKGTFWSTRQNGKMMKQFTGDWSNGKREVIRHIILNVI